VNHIHFLKEDHLPDWARRGNQVKKGDHVEERMENFKNVQKNSTYLG
jgi:hypothetical protein